MPIKRRKEQTPSVQARPTVAREQAGGREGDPPGHTSSQYGMYRSSHRVTSGHTVHVCPARSLSFLIHSRGSGGLPNLYTIVLQRVSLLFVCKFMTCLLHLFVLYVWCAPRRFERAAPHTLSQPCSTCCTVVVAGANAMGLLSFLKGTAHMNPDEDFDRNVEEEIARHLWVRA